MAPKRKTQETVARRSSRSTAASKTTPAKPEKDSPATKKAKIAGDDNAKPDEAKKENAGNAKDKPTGRKARLAEEKSVGNGAAEESKTAKKGTKHGKVDVEKDEGSPPSFTSGNRLLSRTVIIEACTQCKSFKERAEKVKKGLESAVPGITVKINPQKPRRGYFEITEERTEVILSLPDMKRPFELMKKLNLDELVGDIVKRFK